MRAMRYDVILFWFMNDWGKFGRTYEMVCRHLALSPKVGKVLCILPPQPPRKWFSRLPYRIERESGKLAVLTPTSRILPESLFPDHFRKKVNVAMRDRRIARFIRREGFSKEGTILWLFPPHRYIRNLLEMVPREALVTQIVDNHLHKNNERPEFLRDVEEQYDGLARRSDLVFVASPSNLAWFSERNPDCRLFENALDAAFLADPSALPCRCGKRPRLGYVGWITQRTDLELLRFLAGKFPQYDLHIAGPVENTIDLGKTGLAGYPNVTISGEIPYRDVPRFLESLDVCLIPHKDTDYSRAMSPMKLFQYLGSGRPVVTTRVEGVDRWKECVSIASTPEEFVKMIESAVNGDTIEDSRRRIERVRKETWEARIDGMLEAVGDKILGKKGPWT